MARRGKTKKSIYLDQVFGHEDELLKSVREVSERDQVLHMQISAHEGRILQFLLQSIRAEKVVEIGTLYGYSTLYMARALPEKGKIFTCDLSQERQEEAKKMLKKAPESQKITWISGPALETLPSLEKYGPFDMLFIDADKDSYGKYLEWAEKNLRSGGLVAADNSFLFGSVYGEDSDRSSDSETVEVMKKFNQRLSQSSYWRGALIPTEEGLTVSIKK